MLNNNVSCFVIAVVMLDLYLPVSVCALPKTSSLNVVIGMSGAYRLHILAQWIHESYQDEILGFQLLP
jgi:hypothetical protein